VYALGPTGTHVHLTWTRTGQASVSGAGPSALAYSVGGALAQLPAPLSNTSNENEVFDDMTGSEVSCGGSTYSYVLSISLNTTVETGGDCEGCTADAMTTVNVTGTDCQVGPNDINLYAGGEYSLDGKPTAMFARFVPVDSDSDPEGLAAFQAACNFKNLNWEQTITKWPTPSLLISLNPARFQQALGYAPPPTFVAPPSFPDPPPGGYWYFVARGWSQWDSFPFYFDSESTENLWSLARHSTENTLSFSDAPSNPCLLGGVGTNCPEFSAQFSDMRFTTKLVGVKNDNTVVDMFSWNWISTYNGTTGGIVATANLTMVDPGSGTGGVTITSINGFQLNPVDSSQVAVTASGLSYSRVSQTFNGTVTITNISDSTINGPFQLVFMALPSGVMLTNASDMFYGNPFLTVSGTLSPGQSSTAAVQFKNPSNATIHSTPTIYAGSLK